VFELERAATVAEALAVGQRAGIPAQNLVAASRRPHRLDDRGAAARPRGDLGLDLPGAGEHAASHTWSALAAPAAIRASAIRRRARSHRQRAPARRRRLRAIGDGGADLGARQRQLRDSVAALGSGVDEAAMYGVFLDDRALYLAPGATARCRRSPATPIRQPGQARRVQAPARDDLAGRASVDSVAYRLTRAFVDGLYGGSSAASTSRSRKRKRAAFASATSRWPAVIARCSTRSRRLAAAGHADWKALQLAAIDDAIAAVEKEGAPLAEATWGKRNTLRIAHAMASACRSACAGSPCRPSRSGRQPHAAVAGAGLRPVERFAVSPGARRAASSTCRRQSGIRSALLPRRHADWVGGTADAVVAGATTHA
jgi:penicillin amidase